MSDISSILSPATVRGAYGQAKSLTGGPAPAEPAAKGATTFADMVGNATADAVHTVRSAEATMQAGLAGKVDTQAVVEATMAMESTVKVSVAVRNKLVEAYQQIMQMPI